MGRVRRRGEEEMEALGWRVGQCLLFTNIHLPNQKG